MDDYFKIILPVILIFLVSCEDVIEPDLEESAPRLVVEASLVWDVDRTENPQYISLTTTAPYYSDEVTPAEGAEVFLYGPGGETYTFEEIEPGFFRNDGFTPESGADYELQIFYDGEEYRATERLVPTVELEFIEQINDGGFIGDEIELRAFYTDPADTENYYLFQFYHDGLSLQLGNDDFTNGNQSFARYSDEDLEPGDIVSVYIQGISERFYQYLNLLVSQTGNRGGPFQTQPTTVRGNVVNVSNPDNFAFGYFRLSGANMLSYEVK